MTLHDLKVKIIDQLSPVVGKTESSAMARIIVEDVLGIDFIKTITDSNREIEDETYNKVNSICRRIIAGEPLQYIIGSTVFHGLRLNVRPGVLIPRPETSALVDIVIDAVKDNPDLRILDVCTGSGAIAVSLGRSLSFPHITAMDISAEALLIAKENVANLGLKNIKLLQSDILADGLPGGEYDIVISNPPYVLESERKDIDRRVIDYEPQIALFVPDNNPLVFYKKIAADAFNLLKTGGLIFFEINPTQAGAIKKLLSNLGYKDVECRRDFAGRYRYAIAQR